MRGGWGLDALGKFFRRRRRPRPPGVGGGDAETLAFPEIKCSPQAAFDSLNCDFGDSGMRGWIRLVKRARNDEIRAKVD